MITRVIPEIKWLLGGRGKKKILRKGNGYSRATERKWLLPGYRKEMVTPGLRKGNGYSRATERKWLLPGYGKEKVSPGTLKEDTERN